MKIHLATDHAGYEMKEATMAWLLDNNYEVVDHGAFEFQKNDDYPDFIKKAAKAISENPDTEKAIVFGGSGQGEAIVANRFKSVRAVVYYGKSVMQTDSSGKVLDIIHASRVHSNANVLSMGARFISIDEAKEAIKLWLGAEFFGEERHVRRINKIDKG